jgi:hypothetical protein
MTSANPVDAEVDVEMDVEILVERAQSDNVRLMRPFLLFSFHKVHRT